jgi:copper chaperone CopZ
MNTATTVGKRLLCPACGKKGKRVGTVTIRALLKEEYASEAGLGPPARCEPPGDAGSGCQPLAGDTGWRFCDSAECDVVYFAEDHDETFTRHHLRVAVGVKEKTGERPLCYCFGHSVASIQQELRTKGRSDALEDIRAKMQDPGCRCEVTNPSGACCLGSVAKGIQIAKAELGESVLTTPSGNKAETITKIGTLLSAVMASSCCWLPLLLLAVGVSGAGIAATLEQFRPVFIVVTVGFLGSAFYLTYRTKKAVADGVHSCCAPEAPSTEACCLPSINRRFSLMTLNKVMLWVVTVLAVAFLFFPKYVGLFLVSREVANTTVNDPLVQRTTIAIEGMTCEACAVALQKTIKAVPGVLNAQMDFKTKQAIVSTEARCPFPKDEILKAIELAGFTGVVTETK